MSGRAVGRARGMRGAAPPSEPIDMPGQDTGSGSGSPTGPQMRGRASLRLSPRERLVTRPEEMPPDSSRGSSGLPIALFTNYFALNTPKDKVVNSYHVSFQPDIEAIKVRRALITNIKELFGNAYLFDGGSNIKTLADLPDEETIKHVKTTTGLDVEIKIKMVEQVSWGSPEMMRLYNTQMRRNLQHLGWTLIYRYFYDPSCQKTLPEFGLRVLMGLSTAIAEHDGGLLLNCDSISKIVQTETVLHVLKNIFDSSKGRVQDFRVAATRALIGKVVITGYNNKTYRIDDIDWDNNPTFEFERRNGRTTIKDYMREQYNVNISDLLQPLLLVLPSQRQLRDAENRNEPPPQPIRLVPECCSMTGVKDNIPNPFDVKRQLTQMTQLKPRERFSQMMNFKKSLGENPDVRKEMTYWGLSFGSSLMDINGRILDKQAILMGGSQRELKIENPGDFSKDIRTSSMFGAKIWKTWAVIYVAGRDEACVQDFMQNLRRVCGPLGIMPPTAPIMVKLSDDRVGSYLDAHRNQARDCDFVVSIVPNNNKDRYDAIKKLCYIDAAKLSQVIVARTLFKKNMLMSVATKIAIQMAAKSGSVPWALSIPTSKLMVCGYDTYHDATLKGKSVGGFVCTLNNSLTSYFSKVDYHTSREEMSSLIARSFEEGLKAYRQVNGELPQKIVVYRDGVGDGMIAHVFKTEVALMREVLNRIAPVDTPAFAFVIVTKRINTRFFHKYINPHGGGNSLENPPPGTCVDHTVTKPERYEFFLVSQQVRQGTVAPTNYNVICNLTNFKPNAFQQLTYKLCHTYFNWMGTIRVPAPCQYAHKLAFLTGTHLHKEPHARLSDKLFYL